MSVGDRGNNRYATPGHKFGYALRTPLATRYARTFIIRHYTVGMASFALSAAEAGEIEAASYYSAVGFARGSAFTESALLYGVPGLSAAAGIGLPIASFVYSTRRGTTPFPRDSSTRRMSRKFVAGGDYITPTRPMPKRTRKRTGTKSRKRLRFGKNPRTGGFLGIENKFVDYEVDGAAISESVALALENPATPNCLNGIGQGDGESERDGRRVRLSHLMVNGFVNFDDTDGAAPEGGHFVRILIVLDRQTNGTAMSPKDLLKDPTSTNLDVSALRNLANIQRFSILRDITVGQHAPAVVWNGTKALSSEVNVPFHLSVPLNQTVHFEGNGATISQIQDYSLHLLAITSPGGSPAKINYISRVRFYG